MKSNTNLQNAKYAKNDEFYTLLEDIEKELLNYKHHFIGKTVYCNCDNPEWSNFWLFFKTNYKALKLKKLISTHLSAGSKAYKLEYDGTSETKNILEGNGDFRSQECVEMLKAVDIVVTNPPFSLFREYVKQLIEYDKKFLIVGSKNAITYKDFFRLIQENKVWSGYNNVKSFKQSDGAIKHFGNIQWFTNLDTYKRHTRLNTGCLYEGNECKYLRYDNYEAINVDRVNTIPEDYLGVMGVPITFIDKFCPEQFEILGITDGSSDFPVKPCKKYINPVQVNLDKSTANGSHANTRATILLNEIPECVYHIADNSGGPLLVLYCRLLIKRRI